MDIISSKLQLKLHQLTSCVQKGCFYVYLSNTPKYKNKTLGRCPRGTSFLGLGCQSLLARNLVLELGPSSVLAGDNTRNPSAHFYRCPVGGSHVNFARFRNFLTSAKFQLITFNHSSQLHITSLQIFGIFEPKFLKLERLNSNHLFVLEIQNFLPQNIFFTSYLSCRAVDIRFQEENFFG